MEDTIFYKFVVIGGGIAGVTCAESLTSLSPDDDILLVTASKLIKAIKNYQKVSRTLESFDVEERSTDIIESECPKVKVIHTKVTSVDTDKHIIYTENGQQIQYGSLCLCMGGKPKMIAKDNPYVIGIRDTESVQVFQKRLRRARRIVVIGNGGIATELVYEVEGCEVIWAIKHKSITSTFIDAGAAQFCLPQLSGEKSASDKPLKRLKYTEEESSVEGAPPTSAQGSALGPDWASDLEMKGVQEQGHKVHVEYQVEVARLWSLDELIQEGKSDTCPDGFIPAQSDPWPVYVELTNGIIYGCDFVVSATGVVPFTDMLPHCKFDKCEDGGLKVDTKMETSVPDVFAAGDICSVDWDCTSQWQQMRLWSQARQMGNYAAKCMVAKSTAEEIHMDFCFEMFAHVTNFFNYKVILLGRFNGQGCSPDHEILLRVTKGVEYVKAVLDDNRLQGAILIGETDLEETFENLILNQTDLGPFKDHLLEPNIDIEDFFD